MSTRVEIKHSTIYRYSEPMVLSPQLIRLRPAPYCRTEISRYQLNIQPLQHLIHWQQDAFNNHIARLIFSHPVNTFSIDVTIIANITTINPYDFYVDDNASQWPLVYSDPLRLDLSPYLFTETIGAAMRSFLQSFDFMSMNIVDFLLLVSQALLNRISYTRRLSPGVQSCDESLEKGSGSCRDSAWLLVQTFRHLGLAARFVSGYFVELANTNEQQSSMNSPVSSQADSTDLHAWAEVFIPGAGWIGIDSTSGLLTGEGHIPLCSTREPSSAAPVSGKMGPGNAELFFENTVTRLDD